MTIKNCPFILTDDTAEIGASHYFNNETPASAKPKRSRKRKTPSTAGAKTTRAKRQRAASKTNTKTTGKTNLQQFKFNNRNTGAGGNYSAGGSTTGGSATGGGGGGYNPGFLQPKARGRSFLGSTAGQYIG